MKFFYGKWDSWGIEISWSNSDKTFTLAFAHWYIAFCLWKLWRFDFVRDETDITKMLDKEAYRARMGE